MAPTPQILCLFDAPDRTAALAAVGRMIGSIMRTHALNYVDIAKTVGCSSDTVERAAGHTTLLSLETVAKLVFFFPDCSAPLLALFAPTAAPPSVDDRLERIVRDIGVIRTELGER